MTESNLTYTTIGNDLGIPNPFPGLRPFGMGEGHLFFGREGQSDELLQKLSDNRFVAITGASATGKSSLISSGLIPLLHGGFILQAGSKWKIISSKPGNQPIDNLAEAIVKSDYAECSSEEKQIKKSIFSTILRRSSLGITEVLKNNSTDNILIIIDQFEELFRYRLGDKDPETQKEPGPFIKLLVEAVHQTQLSIYVVIAMRSDFIGECSQYQELAWLVNNSSYLIPQMTRDDFSRAITGPITVSGAAIEPSLVQRLLNDVGSKPDQLPLLQHALMRTWDYWLNNSNPDKPISVNEYLAIGTMERALSEHANEAFDELTEKGKKICEILFKTLTEKGSDNRGVRRPTKLADIASIAKVTTQEVIDVIEKFRQTNRSFIVPPCEVELTPDSIIDLLHESLIRIWDKLKVWVDEEAEAGEMYLRLSEASTLYLEGKTGLWRPPDLDIALSWEEKQQPTLTWAKRYNPAFERAMVFLRTSQSEFEAEEENKIELQRKRLQRIKLFAVVFGVASIISISLMLIAYDQKIKAAKITKVALQQKMIASIQKAMADKNAQQAFEQKNKAYLQSLIALQQKEQADEQSIIAFSSAEEALKEKDQAYFMSQEALQQKTVAEQNAVEANEQKTAAMKASEEAYNRRLTTIAQSMAEKSLLVDDASLKALLAFQSFMFTYRHNGNTNNTAVYSALYNTLGVFNKKLYNVYAGHTDAVNSLVFEPGSNMLYSASSDGHVFKWNLADSSKIPIKVIENGVINKALDISPDGRWLILGTSGAGIALIDTRIKSNPVKVFSALGKNISALAFMPDGRTVVAASENTLFTWNIDNGSNNLVGTTDGNILCLSVSPNGRFVATGTKTGKTILWNVTDDFSQTVISEEAKNQIHAVCFNNKGTQLATGNLLGYLKVFNVPDGKLLYNIHGHSARITDIKFSAADNILATSSYDQTVLVWDANNYNATPLKFKGHTSWCLSLAFSSKGNYIVSASSKEDRMILWPTQSKILAEQLYRKISRNFTQDEWNVYVGSDIPYEKILTSKP
jgi:WD40 repeat protein